MRVRARVFPCNINRWAYQMETLGPAGWTPVRDGAPTYLTEAQAVAAAQDAMARCVADMTSPEVTEPEKGINAEVDHLAQVSFYIYPEFLPPATHQQRKGTSK